jgi:hypothetical protein
MGNRERFRRDLGGFDGFQDEFGVLQAGLEGSLLISRDWCIYTDVEWMLRLKADWIRNDLRYDRFGWDLQGLGEIWDGFGALQADLEGSFSSAWIPACTQCSGCCVSSQTISGMRMSW